MSTADSKLGRWGIQPATSGVLGDAVARSKSFRYGANDGASDIRNMPYDYSRDNVLRSLFTNTSYKSSSSDSNWSFFGLFDSDSVEIEEVEDFLRRTKSAVEGNTVEIVGEMKFDGTSISIVYEHGRMVRAVTRGDGVRGDDVTVNVKTIPSVPMQLQGNDFPESFEVRGEIVMPWKSFEALNQERAYNEEPLLANPRNAAATGIFR